MVGNISRRKLLRTVPVAGLAGIAGCTGGSGDGDTATETSAETDGNTDTAQSDSGNGGGGSAGSVKIGVIQPLSGPLTYYGQQSLWGMFSGFAYKAGTDPIATAESGTQTVTVGDVDYELVIRDTELSADKAQSVATDLVQNESVDLLFGATSSAAADRVVKNVAKPSGTPMMVGPAASASITASSETCTDSVFRVNENTAMDARSGGKYVASETDVNAVYLLGADYSFGHAVVSNYRSVLEAEGIEIVGEKFVPQGYSEFEGLLDNAAEAGAEGVVGGFTAQTLPALITTFINGGYDMRLFGGFATEITNTVIGQTLQKALGKPLTKEKIAQQQFGPFTTRYHWNQYDNDINSAYVDMHTSTYGKVPDLLSAGQFTAASALVQAVEESGSTEGADIAAALRGMTVADTPKGNDGYTFQTYNNQARSEMTIADPVPTTDEWTDQWGAAIMPSAPVARIAADEVTIPSDSPDMSCRL
ncbi:amino acid/amide ABC transporter substrate-binding protein, haat family [Haloferax elongans ATCC BAA-1513]|uniref:Amino acid/amide ABC transporter substrate-binding protein, haat family n=1 Tax=Haloferax elongans ATCC BAA-1513 TaxID=1230453 RepID=M0HBI7_HALEO|nr:ABC transporter substrate-binding protein [Haloferax elongans]ELZ81057.1 amino acid/amide ABC transporter substrate-binding protein, haat family [Haloferax elongans ATCC BAA-1513]